MNAAVLQLIREVLKEIEPFNIRIRNDSAINEDIPVVRLDFFLEAIERRIEQERTANNGEAEAGRRFQMD